MTIDQVKEKRLQLESDLLTLIKLFVEQTGTVVEDLKVSTVTLADNRQAVCAIEVITRA